MDKIDALISNFETMVSLDARCNVWVAPGKLDAARAAIRAEFDAQAKRIEELDLLYKLALGRIELGDNRIATLESELAALKEAQRWIPVDDMEPLDDQLCVVYNGEIYLATWCEGWMWDEKTKADDITHWMPLPQPPEAE